MKSMNNKKNIFSFLITAVFILTIISGALAADTNKSMVRQPVLPDADQVTIVHPFGIYAMETDGSCVCSGMKSETIFLYRLQ